MNGSRRPARSAVAVAMPRLSWDEIHRQPSWKRAVKRGLRSQSRKPSRLLDQKCESVSQGPPPRSHLGELWTGLRRPKTAQTNMDGFFNTDAGLGIAVERGGWALEIRYAIESAVREHLPAAATARSSSTSFLRPASGSGACARWCRCPASPTKCAGKEPDFPGASTHESATRSPAMNGCGDPARMEPRKTRAKRLTELVGAHGSGREGLVVMGILSGLNARAMVGWTGSDDGVLRLGVATILLAFDGPGKHFRLVAQAGRCGAACNRCFRGLIVPVAMHNSGISIHRLSDLLIRQPVNARLLTLYAIFFPTANNPRF